ncbi:uncharacterized protein LOC115079347 isoform X2 [Rhinatrema bivittatum]|nr:uncharacterized protein LOC115079347 isoform X2 [Rhinatrema bivittatum]
MYWTIKPSCYQSTCPSISDQAETDLATLQQPGSKELPQSCAPYPVPRPLFITIPVLYQTPVFSATVSSCSQPRRAKEIPIAPKLPVLTGNQNACPKASLAPANETTGLAGAESHQIVAKRWKSRGRQRSRPHRKANPRRPEPDHVGHLTLESTSSLSTDKNAVETVSSFETPTKTAFLQGLCTSTPCRDGSGVLSPGSMLVSWRQAWPTPRLQDSMLDCSLLKSPSNEALGCSSLGFTPLQETAQARPKPESGERDLEELLGISPLRGAASTDALGFDQQNDCLAKIFSDFSMPSLDEGADMTNMSWTFVYNRN